MAKAYFHLPGLFEFFELYQLFLPIYQNHREYFYEWCEIASIYGAPANCLWSGGRISQSTHSPKKVLSLLEKYNISARLTFSNSLLNQNHLSDSKCNTICTIFSNSNNKNGIIIHSDLLLRYLQKTYSNFYFVSSTTKVLTQFSQLVEELNREEFTYVVPDFRLNKSFTELSQLTEHQKNKVEFLCNECCWIACKDRKACYENVSRKNLDEHCPDHICHSPHAKEGYKFSSAMQNPSFISIQDITQQYLPLGFTNFKIEGRGLGSALILEFLLYYMVKPEYHIHVRESIYLDNSLDLF